MTEYVVLAKTAIEGEPEGLTYWQFVGGVSARSARAAIRAVPDLPEGTFVAVPERSFQPVTVKVETKTALRFS